MSIFADKYTLNAGTATKIVPAQVMAQQVIVHNHDHGGNDSIYIGDSSLGTALNGMHVPDTETLKLVLYPGDELFAIASSATPQVHVFVSRL
jgi:hypothetical protein